MTPDVCADQMSIPPPSYHRIKVAPLHRNALTLVRRLCLLELCRVAVKLARQQCPLPLPAGPGGAPRVYREESLLLLALLRTLWRLSYQELHDWLVAWPALAFACVLPLGPDGQPRVPSKAQHSKRLRATGAPASEMLFVLVERAELRGCGWGSSRGATSSSTAPARLLLVCRRDAGCADLRRGMGHCPGRVAGLPPRVDPLTTPRSGLGLEEVGVMKHPRFCSVR